MQFIKKIIVLILILESRLILKKYKPFIVAVTGSVGKTSTKDAIYCVIKDQSKYVRKSEKSMNSEIGLPLTVIGVPNAWRSMGGWFHNISAGLRLILKKSEYPDCLVLEIGADHPGDIKNIAKWLNPDIVVITKISQTPVHVEFFASPEQVFEEKAALAEGVKTGGTIILFVDDPKIMTIVERVKGKNPNVISFGTVESATVRGSDYAVAYSGSGPSGFSFKIAFDGREFPVEVKSILGRTYMYPLLAAAAVGKARGLQPEKIAENLGRFLAPKGRMNVIRGINGSTIIDDTYNSSPDAALSALDTLKELQSSGSKVAILGDMMELGKYSADEHRRIGAASTQVVSRLITVGQRSRISAGEAVKSGLSENMVESFDTATDAAEHIPPIVKAGDIILVKGSQSIRMERVVKALMAESEMALDLLVRQEKEWLEKK